MPLNPLEIQTSQKIGASAAAADLDTASTDQLRDWDAAAIELRRWIYGGGKVLLGLVTRREAEAVLIVCRDSLVANR